MQLLGSGPIEFWLILILTYSPTSPGGIRTRIAQTESVFIRDNRCLNGWMYATTSLC